MEHGIKVNCEAGMPVVLAQRQKVPTAVDPRVVNQNIDTPQLFYYRLDQTAACVAGANVRRYCNCLTATSVDFLDHYLRRFQIDVADYYRCALARQACRDCRADAACGACHDRNFVFKSVHHRLLLVVLDVVIHVLGRSVKRGPECMAS
ncbi:hypothetical protein D9M71_628150 [compost metagenome]